MADAGEEEEENDTTPLAEEDVHDDFWKILPEEVKAFALQEAKALRRQLNAYTDNKERLGDVPDDEELDKFLKDIDRELGAEAEKDRAAAEQFEVELERSELKELQQVIGEQEALSQYTLMLEDTIKVKEAERDELNERYERTRRAAEGAVKSTAELRELEKKREKEKADE